MRSQVVPIIESMSDEDLAIRLDAMGALSAAEMYMDRFSDAVEHSDRGLRVGRATGRTAFAPTLVPVLGTCAWVLGEVDRGVGVLEEAVEVARISRNDLGLAWGLLNLSLAQAVQGDLKAAVQNGSEACELASSLGDSAISSWAGLGSRRRPPRGRQRRTGAADAHGWDGRQRRGADPGWLARARRDGDNAGGDSRRRSRRGR